MKLKAYTKKIDGSTYIAHILYYDIMAYGQTEKDAIERALSYLRLHKHCLKHGILSAKENKPAPLKYYIYWHLDWWLHLPARLIRVAAFLDLYWTTKINSLIIHDNM